MISSALVCTIVFWLCGTIDFSLMGWALFTRPLICGPITGLLLGDLNTGLMMGAAIEAIYMGVANIGGSAPADPCPATILAVAFAILTGSDMSAGIMLALPIGTLMQSFTNLLTPFYATLSVYWEKLASSGKDKKMLFQMILFDSFLQRIAQMIVLFLSVAFGVEGLQTLFSSMPGWVINGFAAASGMMTVVGFAIITSMIWSKEVGGFFMIGFVLVKYLNLGTLPIAIILAVIAIAYFYNDQKIASAQLKPASKNNNNEEEFF